MDTDQLAALARTDPNAAQRELAGLDRAERIAFLGSLAPRVLWGLIFAADEPAALVRALEPVRFFSLFHEVGASDAVDLLPLATVEQITFCLDLECWRRGTLDRHRLDEWLARLVEVGGRTLFRTVAHLDFELLLAIFTERLRVFKRDEDTDAIELDDPSLRTFDDLYYFAFDDCDEETEQTLTRVLGELRSRAPELVLQIFESLRQELPSAVEEDARRFRDGRLADSGLPDYDQSLAVLARVDVHRFDPEQHRKLKVQDEQGSGGPSLGTALVRIGQTAGTFLARSWAALSPSGRDDSEREIVYTLNKVLVASVEDFADLPAVDRTAHAVYRHLSIGLEHLSHGDAGEGTNLLEQLRLERIFQLGRTLQLDLRKRARRLVQSPWFAPFGGKSAILGYLADQTITAVSGEIPAYPRALDRDGEAGIRPFEDLADVHRVDAVLGRAEAIAVFLFERTGAAPHGWEHLDLVGCTISDFRDLAAHQVVATMISWSILDGHVRFEPLPIGRLVMLHESSLDAAPDVAAPASLPKLRKDALSTFDRWLAERLGGLPLAFTSAIQRLVEECGDALARELGAFPAGAPIDPLALPTLVVRAPDLIVRHGSALDEA